MARIKPPPGSPLDWSHPAARSLVLAWNFLEGVGSPTVDATGRGQSGTFQNGAAWSASPGGPSVLLSGSDAKVTGTGLALPTGASAAWSLECVYATTATVSLAAVWSFGTALPTGGAGHALRGFLQFGGSAPTNHVYFWGDNADWDSGISWVTDGLPHHYLFTTAGGSTTPTIRLYVDGRQRASGTPGNTLSTAGTAVTAGSRHSSGTTSAGGKLLLGRVYAADVGALAPDLASDPWALRRTPSVRRFFVPAGGGASPSTLAATFGDGTFSDSVTFSAPLDLADPVDRRHPLNRGRLSWQLVLPGLDGGATWYDLMGLYPAALNSFGTGNGWQGTARLGGWGQLKFDGTSSYAQANSAGPTGACTIALWGRPSGSSVYCLDWGSASNNSRSILYGFQTSAWNCYKNGYPTGTASQTQMTASGGWDRVLYTTDGTNLRGYLNGVRVVDVSANLTRSPGPTTLSIGRPIASASNYYGGTLDDIGLWSRMLSDAEAWADYDLSRRGYPGALTRVGPSAYLLSATVGGLPGPFYFASGATVGGLPGPFYFAT